jgi:transposase
MTLYCGIDLHSNNLYVCVIDDDDQRLLERKLPNDSQALIALLHEFRQEILAVAIESTFNWYWLADALTHAGFEARLVNTAKVVQYSGLKRSDDRYDAFFLAHLMRLNILPTGYICPVQHRGLRDLLRKRMSLVQTRTQQILSIKTQYQRACGRILPSNDIRRKDFELAVVGDANVQMAMQSNLTILDVLNQQIKALEKSIFDQTKSMESLRLLKSVDGIGDILALVIVLETGEISRFKSPGNYASYCRCVDSRRESNGKRKGENNRKNGNKYLSWAYIEAANYAIRYNAKAEQFYQRKRAKTNRVVALKALSHKLARACYHMMAKQVPFDEEKLFAN